MEHVYLACPFCSTHLELPGDVRRSQAMCPSCDSIFDLDAARKQTQAGRRTTGDAADRKRLAVLAGLLAALAFLALLSWAPAGSPARGLATGISATVFAGSALCALYALLSMAGGKSLVPGAIAASAWGLGVGVWLIGGLVAVGRVSEAQGTVTWAFYAGLAGAFVVFVAGTSLLVRSQGKRGYAGLPLVLIVAFVAAGAAGGAGAYSTAAGEYDMLHAAAPPAEDQPAPREREREQRPRPTPRDRNDDDEEQERSEPEDPRPLPEGLKALVKIEAESAADTGDWGVERDKDASGRRYLQWHGPEKSMNAPPEEHILRYEVDIPQDGRYSVYGDVLTPNQSSDSFWVRFEEYDIGKSKGIERKDGWLMVWTGTRDSWDWVSMSHEATREAAEFHLEKGKHALLVGWRESGARLDRLAIVRAD